MISGADFLALQKLLLERCGMALTSDKLYLVGSRLSPVAQALGLRGVIELMTELRERPREAMVTAVVEAMVTHESLFFRDDKPFEILARSILPELAKARAARKTLRIWSAACSSGQEPYSIAMLLSEEGYLGGGWRCEIVGTDISAPILEKARAGRYSAFEARRGLSDARIARHFRRIDEQTLEVNAGLRGAVQFRQHNLIDSAAHLGAFDIVFCRNVLIYFDAATKARTLEVVARQIAADGALFLGSADSVIGVSDKFAGAAEGRGLYRPVAPPKARIA